MHRSFAMELTGFLSKVGLTSKLFLFLMLAVSCSAQQTVTGTCSISLPVPSLPSGMSFDGKTLKVPAISTQSLTINDSTSYPEGIYLASISGGVLTFVPYTASAPSSYTVVIPAQKQYAVFDIPIMSFGDVPVLQTSPPRPVSLVYQIGTATNYITSVPYYNLQVISTSTGLHLVGKNTAGGPLPSVTVTVTQ